MHFIADFHIHSHFSIATSKECCPEHLAQWAKLKGLHLIGTGDFTHPGWMKELKEKLEPAEAGLYRLKSKYAVSSDHYAEDNQQVVRFILSAEISSIYKKNGRTRKIHNLLLVPDLADAEKINGVLDRLGNIRSDGRPILGLDSRNLLEIALEQCPEVMFIPAHIWTPHFSLLGSRSGFDSLEECFEDLSEHIFALETGLSSDPAMNWRLSALDKYTLVSNSDAHSPKNLAREANCFHTDLSYPAIKDALQSKDLNKFLGTIEFYPQEGKYHYDGHRACHVCWSPEESKAAAGICSHCGRKITLGVLYRVLELADRPQGARPDFAPPYESIVPLPKILSDFYQMGENSKRVQHTYFKLLSTIGSELEILRTIPIKKIQSLSNALLAEGIRRVRSGEVKISPGFDGEYGKVKIFQEEDRQKFGAQISLFGLKNMPKKKEKISGKQIPLKITSSHHASIPPPLSVADSPEQKESAITSKLEDVWLSQLNSQQKSCVTSSTGPIIIVAGPGTGKTRTLVCRIAYLIKFQEIGPQNILAVTFTNKAALELKSRFRQIFPLEKDRESLTTGTFHRICLNILQKEQKEEKRKTLINEQDALSLVGQALAEQPSPFPRLRPQRALQLISKMKTKTWVLDIIQNTHLPIEKYICERIKKIIADSSGNSTIEENQLLTLFQAYQTRLQGYHLYDYDDLLLEVIYLFRSAPALLQKYCSQFTHVLVDEFQDVNEVQYLLVKLLAGDASGLLVIGDPDQAIYTFRGADFRFFARLQEDFPSYRLFHLEKNYRSRISILKAAEALIQNNSDRFPLKLKPHSDEKGKIQLRFVGNEQAEGISIVHEIGQLIGGIDMLQAHGQGKIIPSQAADREFGFSDFAVLFRTGQQAAALEECFLREGIPYRVVGQKGFLQSPQVRTIFSLLHFLINPDNDFYVWNLFQNYQEITLGSTAMKHLHEKSLQNQCSLFCALKQELEINAFTQGDTKKCRQILSLWENYQPKILGNSEEIITDLIQKIKGEKDENLKRLQRCSKPFSSVSEFLNNLLLFQDGDLEYRGGKTLTKGEAVSLMTIHAAKGLEFPVVFICGLEEGLLPYDQFLSSSGPQSAQHLEEERRLFYVALTRAQDEIILLSAHNRQRYNQKQFTKPSMFLKEIPDDFITRNKKISNTKSRQLRLW